MVPEDHRPRPWSPPPCALVVGLVALRGSEPCGDFHKRIGRSLPANTVRCIALCVGGSHSLVYQANAPWEPLTGTTGKIEFYNNNMQPLHAFLADARVTVACLGADDAAKEIVRSWGLHVARPTDLNRLVERAYGKEAEVDVQVDGRTEKMRVKVKHLDMEGMALLVLGQEMLLEKTPPKVAQADWGRMVGKDELMYAMRDAYLCFEIAVRCLQKLGASVA